MHRIAISRNRCRTDFLANVPSATLSRAPVHFLTLSLADALPRDVLDWVQAQRLMHTCLQQRDGVLSLTGSQVPRRAEDLLDDYLDAGTGSCLLARPEMAETVAAALAYSDGCGYDLKAWCLMPNHVHVVLSMRETQTLASVVFAWKKFTSRKARKMVRGDAELWRRDYDERRLETERQVESAVEYVVADPVRAGLANWPWVWSDRNSIDNVITPDYVADTQSWLTVGAASGAASL
jgi:REP element-mobilizing transposase RayT